MSIAFVPTRLNGFSYCYLIIQFNINHLCVQSKVVTSIAI